MKATAKAPTTAAQTRRAASKARTDRAARIRPLADRVLVERLEDAKVSTGGIVIPDTAKEKPQRARVVAVGPGRLDEDGKRIKPDLREGDHILIGKYSGTEVKVDDTDYVILREDDVLGIIER